MARAKKSSVDKLVRGELWDPHSLLGRHPGRGGTTIRAWQPDAQTVEAVIDGQIAAKLEKVHPAGLFEGKVEGTVEDYRLQVGYADGSTYTIVDPYSFLPTLGEVDLHLLGEGSHRRLHEKLGAHLRVERGISGVSFAVWAPAARAVRVVGDFNQWDARLHPMRVLGSSGIWELFLPDVPVGSFYKFEIVPQKGRPVMKTDPYAFATEEPPGTASRVWHTGYEWN